MEVEARDQTETRKITRRWCEMLPVRSLHLGLFGKQKDNEVIFLFFVFNFESRYINNETKETQLCLQMTSRWKV